MEIRSRDFCILKGRRAPIVPPVGQIPRLRTLRTQAISSHQQGSAIRLALGGQEDNVPYARLAGLPKLLYVSLYRVLYSVIVVILGIRQLLTKEGAQKGRSTWQTRAFSTT
jgi:hypothetical protein